MKAGDKNQFRAPFEQIKARFDRDKIGDGLICKQGFYNDCPVLKLQKATWSNDPMDQLRNQTGIFFSIWIDEEAARLGRANYNIHALKLRHLKGYSIASRDFASDFRKAFAAARKNSPPNTWPNVSVDFGPLTLMQGWFEIKPGSLEKEALGLMESFMSLSPLIDRLLAERRR